MKKTPEKHLHSSWFLTLFRERKGSPGSHIFFFVVVCLSRHDWYSSCIRYDSAGVYVYDPMLECWW